MARQPIRPLSSSDTQSKKYPGELIVNRSTGDFKVVGDNGTTVTEHKNYKPSTVAGSDLAATAAVGTSEAFARADHKHKLPTAAQVGALASGATAVAASKVTSSLTFGSKTFNGSAPVTLTASDLGALTAHQSLAAYAKLNSPALTGTPTAPTAASGTSTTQIATTAFVANAVSAGIAASDAMIFKGVLDGTHALPTKDYKIGWTYRVTKVGTYAGQKCEIGDLVIAVKNCGSAFANSDWTVAQTNIDGAITNISSTSLSVNRTGSSITISHPTHSSLTSGLYKITVDSLGHVTAGVAVTTKDIASLAGAATSDTPSALGTAAVGTSDKYARADHVHAMPTAAQVGALALSGGTLTGNLTGKYGTFTWLQATVANHMANGSNTEKVAIFDSSGWLYHRTAKELLSDMGAATASDLTALSTKVDGIAVPTASSTAPAALGTAAIGTSNAYARADHVHALPTASQIGALPKAGGTVSGGLTVNGKLTVGTAGNVAGIAVTYTATLTKEGWTGTDAPFSQVLSIAGITASDKGIWMDIKFTGTYETDKGYDEAFSGAVYRAVSSAGKITVYAHSKPEIAIPVNITVVR